MEIQIQLTSTAIVEHQPPPVASGVVGAWIEFRGLVRGEEDGRSIAALEYEAYASMAESEMRRVLTDLALLHPCRFARVIHRVGVVPVGEAAIYVGVAAPHGAEAFGLLREFMARLKQDVPIWKRRTLTAEQFAALPR